MRILIEKKKQKVHCQKEMKIKKPRKKLLMLSLQKQKRIIKSKRGFVNKIMPQLIY